MPAGNGRGPMGLGPMTGRGLGYCSGKVAPGYGNLAPMRGYGMFQGRGRRGGWRYWQGGGAGRMNWGGYASNAQGASSELERQSLKSQADLLQSELQRIQQRLADLEAEKES